MADPQQHMERARAALQQGDADTAIRLATEIINRKAAAPHAHLLRARARLASGAGAAAFADAIDALPHVSAGPLARQIEDFILNHLLDDLDRNLFKTEALGSIADLLDRVPRLAAVVQLLHLLRQHDAAAARDFGTALPVALHSPPALALMVRCHLHFGDLDAAIAARAGALALLGHPAAEDSVLVALAGYRESRRRGLREATAFRPRYRLAVCAVLKDEADDLAEWLAFHANLGVEAFYLYENQSSDRTPDIIRANAARFNITCHPLAAQPAQQLAYRHFLDVHRFETEWAAVIDGDEFIVPEGDSLIPHLDRDAGCGAIAMNWRVFGSAGHVTRPEDLCLAAFTKRAADDHVANTLIKCILRPQRVIRYRGPHEQLILGRHEDGHGQPVVPFCSRISPPRYNGLAVHHYAIKSREQSERKLTRGRPMANSRPDKFRDQSYITWYDSNDVEDRSALRFADGVRDSLRQMQC